MKNKILYFLLLVLLAPFVLLTGCQDDEVVDSSPEIILSTTRASLQEIKLDENTGPAIRGWAVAEAGLEQVRVIAQTNNGEQELLKETSFTEENSEMNGTRYQFVVQPEYTPDFNSIIISISDVQGRTDELTLEVGATGGTAGPTMSGFAAGVKANIRETVNLRPSIQGTVNSHFGLSAVRYLAVYNDDTEEEIEVISTFGDDPTEFDVDFVPDYDQGFERGMTAIKIVGTDERGFENEISIPVSIVDSDPAPTVNFEEESIEADLTANPQETPEVSGTVATEFGGLAEVRFYLVYTAEEVEIEEEAVVFADNEEDDSILEFSFTPEYSLGLSGIKVVATDDNGQVMTETLPVKVIADDPDLQTHANIIVNAQAKRHDEGVVTSFSADGDTYTLAEGQDPEVSENIDFITTDSGGNNGMDLFSPSHEEWLPNNYFKKDASGDMTWPVLNETKMVHLEDKDETFFNNATSIDIRALSVGEDYETRVEFGPDEEGNHFTNQVILFENSRGQKGLLLFKESNNDPGKADVYTFDIKVVNVE